MSGPPRQSDAKCPYSMTATTFGTVRVFVCRPLRATARASSVCRPRALFFAHSSSKSGRTCCATTPRSSPKRRCCSTSTTWQRARPKPARTLQSVRVVFRRFVVVRPRTLTHCTRAALPIWAIDNAKKSQDRVRIFNSTASGVFQVVSKDNQRSKQQEQNRRGARARTRSNATAAASRCAACAVYSRIESSDVPLLAPVLPSVSDNHFLCDNCNIYPWVSRKRSE
jgi:hypothetical protein